MDRPLWGKLLFVFILLFAPATVFAAASVDVYKVNINNDEISDLDELYVREDSVIELKFNYDVDSSSEVEGWEIWIGAENSGTLFDSGDFSNGTATVNFTTEDIAEKSSGSISGVVLGASANYTYTLTVALDYTTSSTTTTDGDDDDSTTDGDDEINNEPTQALTIRVDMDPPAAMTLLDDPVPGEQSVTVSWEPEILSETGEAEKNVKVQFCVVAVSGAEGTDELDGDTETDTLTNGLTAGLTSAFTSPSFFKVDGDDELDDEESAEAEEAEVEAEQNVSTDGDDDTTEVEAEVEETVDGDDDSDIDNVDEDSAEDDNAVEDGDTSEVPETDGDYEASESEVSYEECLTPIPETDNDDSYRITGLLNGVTYKIRAVAIDAAGNVGLEWSNEIYGTPQQVDDFWEAYKHSGGKEDGGFCFIATAAYGSYSHEDVQLLRVFRDEILMKFSLGRKLVSYYYQTSPPLAKLVAEHPAFAFLVRVALYPVILLLGFMFNLSMVAQLSVIALILCAMASLVYVIRRVRHQEVS